MLISVITIVATIMDNCDFYFILQYFISHLDMMLRGHHTSCHREGLLKVWSELIYDYS